MEINTLKTNRKGTVWSISCITGSLPREIPQFLKLRFGVWLNHMGSFEPCQSKRTTAGYLNRSGSFIDEFDKYE